MPFVKLDCGILRSTLWMDRTAREVFITSLLMAEPIELTEPSPQLQIRTLEKTGWTVPPGWYGFVAAAGVGILHQAMIDKEAGLSALETLASPEPDSRSEDFDGRRLVRVDGGFIVLNFFKYRDRDYSSAERSKRYRERKKASRVTDTPSQVVSQETVTRTRDITHAEAEAEAEARSGSGSGDVPRNGTMAPEWTFVGKVPPIENMLPPDLLSVTRIFEHWKTVHRHPQAKLDNKRLQLIRKMLGSYSEGDLCQAISGYCNSPHHMGQNDKGTVYDDLALLIRDAAHVDAGLRFHVEPPRSDLSEKTRKIISQTDGWQPPEVRNEN